MKLHEKHEIFEIEVLDTLKNSRVLDALIFGGGTMLRLCHEMKRFSADLDFWLRKELSEEQLLRNMRKALEKTYEVTDAQLKYYTILVEVRSAHFPRRLKIEIRREVKEWDFEEKIAFSKFSTRQVILKAHTLKQTLYNKIAALLDRGEIRDAFDMEFILRQGIPLPPLPESQKKKLIRQLNKFKLKDFKVTLGSVLESDIRDYYVKNQFSFLLQKIENAGTE